jgi:N,N'-diacetylchitobiose phosphorylase
MDGVVFNEGIKENGGIFNHPQGWAVMAECLLGNGDQAYEYYRAYMPAAYNTRAEVRDAEPYVHTQTTYATINPNAGKSRVSWLTGTASWSYHSAVQYVLGVRPELDGLRIDPCIPSHWPGFEMQREFRGCQVTLRVKNPSALCKGISQLHVDGKLIEGNLLPLSALRPSVVVEAVITG